MADDAQIEIRRTQPDDVAAVVQAGHLFDRAPQPETTRRFLANPTHHLLLAYVKGEPAGFITGIEMIHPDKGSELMIYELGVTPVHRRNRIGTTLVRAMQQLARELGCYGMWVPIEAGDTVPIATYRAAGGGEPENAAIMTWEFRDT